MKKTNTRFSIKEMTLTGLLTAIICILSPIAIYIPVSAVPISLGTLAIYFALTILGLRYGFISVVLYILLGLAGLPVFAGYTGGAAKLLGPTGGYIIGFLFLAAISGFFMEKWPNKLPLHIVGMILGTLVCYLFGSIWLGIQLSVSFPKALMLGVIPYIPGDIVKLALAIAIGTPVRKRLLKAGLIQ